MRPIAHFKHCPKCGQPLPPPMQPDNISCPACGYLQFFNPTVSVAAFILAPNGHVLLIRRAKEPGQGKLAPPGGFVDFDETAEEALRREIREEVGMELADVAYLCSAVNQYHYKEVTYPVLDLFFVARVSKGQIAIALDDVESCLWLKLDAIREDDLAFDSMKAAFRTLLGGRVRV